MSFLDLAAIVGLILALGAALDFLVKDSARIKIATKLAIVSSSSRSPTYRGSEAINLFFGNRLLSFKAIIRYISISLISLVLAYGFAYFTTADGPDGDFVSIFHDGPTVLDIAIFLLAIISSVCADIISYSQTRIFLNAVDKYRSNIVSLGLIIADGFISIGIFSVLFSVFRFIAYILAMSTVSSSSMIDTEQQFIPKVIADAILTSGLADRTPTERYVEELNSFSQKSDGAAISAVSKQYDQRMISNKKLLDRIEYISSIMCVDDLSLDSQYTAILYSNLLSDKATEERFGDSKEAIALTQQRRKRIAIELYMSSIKKESNKCAFKVISSKRSISQRDFVYLTGMHNAFLASLERTLYDTYEVVGFKFAPYLSFDPYNSQREYLASDQVITQQTFLGLTDPDFDRANIVKSFTIGVDKQRKKLLIPFSPMLASSLSVTIIFSLYLMYQMLLSLRNRVVAYFSKWVPSVDLDKAPFSSICFAAIIVLILAWFALSVFPFFWWIVFG